MSLLEIQEFDDWPVYASKSPAGSIVENARLAPAHAARNRYAEQDLIVG
jgi:hypothetical protein